MTTSDEVVDISDKYHRAYIKVWNEFYRDENLQDEVSYTTDYFFKPLKRAWKKDYFTSALLSPQRGTAPAVPIVGMLPISGGNSPVIFGDLADVGDVSISSSSNVIRGARKFLLKKVLASI